MRMRILMAGLFLLTACSPKFDWREIHVAQGQYVAAFPAKPSTETRNTQLAGQTIAMTMSSSRVDGITFAIASAAMPDATQAKAALPTLKQALLGNFNGQIRQESQLRLKQGEGLQIEASGGQQQGKTPPNPLQPHAAQPGAAQPTIMHARFIAHNQFIYQMVVMGPDNGIPREQMDTFFTSFKVE